ncbi:hypothetical protein [Actinomadura sp. 21ATH]|uniref:hypothetical protein n=1 Tax=Actinomadura sp. 21ATH TaxID=1735444 RepID=UPI0035C0C3EF
MFTRKRKKDSSPSIFDHLRAHIPPEGPGLAEGGETLPDEADLDGTPWAPGARDGVLTHHWGGGADAAEVERLSAALMDAAAGRSGPEAVADAAAGLSVVALVDELLGRVASSDVDAERVYELAYALATTERRREPVKLGIALLGLFDAGHHRDELLVLGRHDEFTLFAMVALGNGDAGAEDVLWDLARQVAGWGRIHLVERLAGSENPRLREWILREGFRNDVMYEYLAGIAAEAGDLAGALARDTAGADDELLYAAGDILAALTEEGGPVEGMSGYADGERAAGLFVDHMATRANDLRHFLALDAVRGYAESAWPDVAARCAEILGRPLWADLARLGLRAEGSAEFGRAARACRILDVPALDAFLDRLRTADPLDSTVWWYAADEAGRRGETGTVAALAAELLPLDRIATGPADEAGTGDAFKPHRCLDHLLPALGGLPGTGAPLVSAALASPVVRNRNMAVRTLHAWGEAAWPAGTRDEAAAALAREPDEGVRKRLEALLDGRPVD